jgi:hypothetical protein
MRKILSAAFLALIPALLTAVPARADEPTGLRANHRLILSEGKTILGLAHPTVRFTDVDNDGRTDYRDGSYQLSYVFNFRDGDDDGYRVLRFSFDKEGKLSNITSGAGSPFVPAFFGGDLVLEALKAGLRESKNADDPVVKELLKLRSSKEFLVKYLQWRQGE